jgi:predicted nucleic acid-binding protein
MEHAKTLRATYGIHALDALHLACANSMSANIFLTTDDRLLRAANRIQSNTVCFVTRNPLAWLTGSMSQG